MSFKKENQIHKNVTKELNGGIRKDKKDVVDRFLSVLWRREVDFKFTTK